MCWMEHINLVSNKVKKKIYLFKELQNILDRGKLRSVYKAITEHITSYGVIGWGDAYDNIYYKLYK